MENGGGWKRGFEQTILHKREFGWADPSLRVVRDYDLNVADPYGILRVADPYRDP